MTKYGPINEIGDKPNTIRMETSSQKPKIILQNDLTGIGILT